MLDPYTPDVGSTDLTVDHYDLDLDYRIGPNRLSAHASLTGRVLQETKTILLDLTGLRVTKATVNGKKVRYSTRGQEVAPDHRSPAEEPAGAHRHLLCRQPAAGDRDLG